MYASPPGNVTRRLWQRLIYFFLPSPCLACSAPVWEPKDALGLCPPCRRRLVVWPERRCQRCGRLVAGAVPESFCCGECREHPPSFARVLSVWAYQPPIDATLTALKFRRLEYLGGHVGRRLGQQFVADLEGCEVVVPVPLHWWRYASRGYNQATSIARPLAAMLQLPLVGALWRPRPTPAQSRLPRSERRENLKGAFKAWRRSRIKGRHVLLVDDVMTTGSTLDAAALCLRRAGAAEVTAITAARTPTQEESLLLPTVTARGRGSGCPSPRADVEGGLGEGTGLRPTTPRDQ